jgi:hypothetical protein
VGVYPDEGGDGRGADGAAAARSRHGGAAGSAERGVAARRAVELVRAAARLARRVQHQVGGRGAAAPHLPAPCRT